MAKIKISLSWTRSQLTQLKSEWFWEPLVCWYPHSESHFRTSTLTSSWHQTSADARLRAPQKQLHDSHKNRRYVRKIVNTECVLICYSNARDGSVRRAWLIANLILLVVIACFHRGGGESWCKHHRKQILCQRFEGKRHLTWGMCKKLHFVQLPAVSLHWNVMSGRVAPIFFQLLNVASNIEKIEEYWFWAAPVFRSRKTTRGRRWLRINRFIA